MSELVITLSTIPPRFGLIGPALDSLLRQTRRADRILLHIPRAYRRFPDWDGTLPQVPRGVEIVRTDDDLGPATKVLFAARAYRGQDVDLLLCDDDRIYEPVCAERLLAAKAAHPGCAIATRGIRLEWLTGSPPAKPRQPRAQERPDWRDLDFQARLAWRRLRHGRGARRPERRLFRKSGHIEIFEGCSGVLVRPDYFDDRAFDIPPEAWSVDDIWLSGMLALRDVPIWLIANAYTPENTDARMQAPLADSTIGGAARGQANRRAAEYLQKTFGIWQ